MNPPSAPPPALRPWQRLSVRLAALFAAVTVIAVGAVGLLIYERHRGELEDTVGTQLLNIARVGVLLLDPALHAEVQRPGSERSDSYRQLQARLAAVRAETLLTAPIRTLTDFEPARRAARLAVVSDGPGHPGDAVPLAPEVVQPLGWTFEDGVARYTRIYRDERGRWISAFAPILDRTGRPVAVLAVDYSVDIYLSRLNDLVLTILYAAAAGALATLVLGLVFARQLTRPISALTAGVTRVAGGDLSRTLPVRSRDEVGQLTRAFNQMQDGLRQRDFIRSAFGRYVSPEVAETLLASPEGLRFGGEKRMITVLMSDLRGYTRFAEQGDPAMVMDVLNGYLARMTDIIIEHGGTINEFIGDAIFAVFGAPLPHADHAERAAGAALAMQRAMARVNRDHAARGLPPFDMGIGLNTGEAVVGNIGSEQRAKYAVVGSAVNVAARVEGATVGGQVFVTAATYEGIRALADVAAPVTVALKGLSEPLALYELRGLSGRFGHARTPESAETDPEAAVRLPLACWIIEDKIVRPDPVSGFVVRVGRHRLTVRLDVTLAALTNVRLRLEYPALGRASEDVYGKVVGDEPADGGRLTRIHLTSITDADREVIEGLVRAGRRP